MLFEGAEKVLWEILLKELLDIRHFNFLILFEFKDLAHFPKLTKLSIGAI